MGTAQGSGFDAVVDLPSDPSSPRTARHFLGRTLAQWQLPAAMVEVATLLVSELTSNAVRHGCGVVTVSIRLRHGAVRVEVHDASRVLPLRRSADLEDEGGRGVWLVESLASRWGADTHPGDGKDVWFELDTGGAGRLAG